MQGTDHLTQLFLNLRRHYGVAVASQMTPYDFLQALNAYMSYLKHEPLLERILVAMREDNAAETIRFAKLGIQGDSHPALLDHIQEHEGKFYPVSQLYDLEVAVEDFSYCKQAKTEAELAAMNIPVSKETDKLKYTHTVSGKSLLSLAKHMYPEQLKYVHTALVERLQWIQDHGVFSRYLDYDAKKGILFLHGKPIPIIGKKVPTNAHYLLTYLFANKPFEQHFYDELEEVKVLLESKKWKSYYDACTEIQGKVKEATGADDFLDFNSGDRMYVRINPEYSLTQ